jgi:hypothetical protein
MTPSDSLSPVEPGLPLLVVVEGTNDIAFLKTISAMLHRHDAQLPDLAELEAQRRLLFLPVGGSNVKDMAPRVAGLNKLMFVLLDKECEPETTERRAVVDSLNQRPGCVALLTSKRALENFLHPVPIMDACGIELHFDDDADVPGLLAQQLLAAAGGPRWNELACKGQKRLRERAKKLLNVKAVERMTPELLAERDPQEEVIGWLRTIQRMIEG